MTLIRYLLTSTVLLSISYLAFRLVYMKGKGFRQQRIFLLLILAFSIALPFAGFRLVIPGLNDKTILNATQEQQSSNGADNEAVLSLSQRSFSVNTAAIVKIYLVISALLLSALLISSLKILKAYLVSEKIRQAGFIILRNRDITAPFSFFRWIFIPSELPESEETESIIIHESIHASQHHSADNLLIGLTAAVMWFNPLIWMMKKSFNLIHEYLADEGTIRSGVDRFRYQALIINNVAEERFVVLSSSFNQSLIKKRMIMMTKDTNKKQWRGSIAMLIPLSLILLSATGFINGLYPEKAISASDGSFLPVVRKAGLVLLPEMSSQDTGRKKPVSTEWVLTKKNSSSHREDIKVIGYANPNGKDSLIYVVDGTQMKDISTINPDSIESVNVMKDDNLIVIRTRKSVDKVNVIKVMDRSTGKAQEKVLYIIDGIESDDKAVIEKIDPSDIESVDVIKGDESIRKAGKSGYDGIVIVKTKKK